MLLRFWRVWSYQTKFSPVVAVSAWLAYLLPEGECLESFTFRAQARSKQPRHHGKGSNEWVAHARIQDPSPTHPPAGPTIMYIWRFRPVWAEGKHKDQSNEYQSQPLIHPPTLPGTPNRSETQYASTQAPALGFPRIGVVERPRSTPKREHRAEEPEWGNPISSRSAPS